MSDVMCERAGQPVPKALALPPPAPAGSKGRGWGAVVRFCPILSLDPPPAPGDNRNGGNPPRTTVRAVSRGGTAHGTAGRDGAGAGIAESDSRRAVPESIQGQFGA
jgi:hypothetical protein